MHKKFSIVSFSILHSSNPCELEASRAKYMMFDLCCFLEGRKQLL